MTTDLKRKLKELLIERLKFEDMTPDDIGDDDPLFAGGLGLDSIDALEIVLTDFAVERPTGSLEPGTYTARVVNEGGVVHALKVDGPTGETESAQLQPGQSAELELDLGEAGEYELTCPVGDHRDRGMEASLAVGGGMGPTTTDETTTEDDEGGYRY